MILSSQNKVFWADPNYIKEIQINWESFVTARDKKLHDEIRVFLKTCLFHLMNFNLSFRFNQQDV